MHDDPPTNRCGGCRMDVRDCECDYERCDRCDRHYDVCDCDDIDAFIEQAGSDWDSYDLMRIAKAGRFTVRQVERAEAILTERRQDESERRELAEYNDSHMPGKI